MRRRSSANGLIRLTAGREHHHPCETVGKGFPVYDDGRHYRLAFAVTKNKAMTACVPMTKWHDKYQSKLSLAQDRLPDISAMAIRKEDDWTPLQLMHHWLGHMPYGTMGVMRRTLKDWSSRR